MNDIKKFVIKSQKELQLNNKEFSEKLGISENLLNCLKEYEFLTDLSLVKKKIKLLIKERRENV